MLGEKIERVRLVGGGRKREYLAPGITFVAMSYVAIDITPI
jgi:hypothetical protein